MAEAQQSLEFDPAAVDADLQALGELGPRLLGSDAESEARTYVVRTLAGAGLQVRRHEFPCLGWSVAATPSLRIGLEGWSADALAFIYSPATSGDGVSGTLEWVGEHWVSGLFRWQKFRIADGSGSTVGYVSARPDGPAVTSALAESSTPLPHFIIGADDLARLRSELASAAPVPVRGTIDACLDRGATGVNLGARISGTAVHPLRIGLCAHLDTTDRSDRAAGATRALIAGLALAQHYARRPAAHSIELMIFTGTEADIAGSKAYVADHPETWDLSLAINVDEIPVGDPQLIASVPEAFEAHLHSLIEPMEWGAPREYRSPLPPGGDHMPFAALGRPVLVLGRGGTSTPAGSLVRLPRQLSPVEAIWSAAEIVRTVIDDLAATIPVAQSKRSLLAGWRDTPWEHVLSLKQY